MKKKIPFFITLLMLVCAGKLMSAAPCCLVDFGIFNSPINTNKLEVRLKPTTSIANGNYSAGTFVIRFLTASGVTLSVNPQPVPNQNPFTYSNIGIATSGLYTYYVYSFGGSNTNQNWSAGEEVLVLGLVVNGGTSTVGFELTIDAFAQSITGGDAFYQELAANGQFGGGSGQQNMFYNTSTSAVLPVELLSFNASLLPNGSVDLDWESGFRKRTRLL